MSHLLQLNPSIRVTDVRGRKGSALVLADYSNEHSSLMLVAWDDDCTLFWVKTEELKAESNWSLGRGRPREGREMPWSVASQSGTVD